MDETTPVDVAAPAAAKPLWRRIVDFPLVAGVLIIFALFAGIWVALLPLKAITKADLPDVPYLALRSFVLVAASIAIYKLATRFIGEDRRDEMPFDRSTRDLPIGIGVSFLLMSAIVGIAALAGGYRLLGWGQGTSLPFLLFTAGIGAGIYEEILIRGVLFRFLEEFGGTWFALALSSALFGLGHIGNPNATVLTSLAIAVGGGLMLGGAYIYTRTLWLPIGLHMGWNFTQGFIWDVPVSGNPVDGLVESQPAGPDLISGGMFGLEASVIALALTVVFAAWLIVRAVRRGHLMRPWWVRRRLAREAAAVAA